VPDADRVGVSRTTGVFLLANHAEALIALGRWDEADARLAEAARHDPPGTLALPWLRLRARLRLARGRETAGALVHQAAGWLGKPYLHAENRLAIQNLRVLHALDACADPVAALEIARLAVREPAVVERPRYAWPLLATAARVASVAPGGNDLARCVRDAAHGLPSRFPAERAFAAQMTALLDGGEDRWTTAVEAWRADGHRYELATALLGLAEAQAHDRAAAAETLTEVTTIADGLGAVPLLDAAETLARRLGVRSTNGTATPPVAGTEILTVREREVLRLVAEGQSNSRIAASLYISPKTASVHVSRIIAKLEVSNRVEAAAVAHRLGLLTDHSDPG
jgi:DNA-binding CsgD family transcriptional regulator